MENELIRIFFRDLAGIFVDSTISDWAQPLATILWLGIVFIPLKGIDRRDQIGGLVYVLFVSAAGVTLVHAIPQNFIKDADFGMQLLSVLAMMGIATTRWNYNTSSFAEEIKAERQKLEEEIASGGR